MSPSIRTCIGCRSAAPAETLVRLVLRPDGGLAIGSRGAFPGRGASLHPSESCVRAALAGGAFLRAFRGRRPSDDPAAIVALVLAHNTITVVPNLPFPPG